MCINNKNAIINNNYGRTKNLILLFKIPWARERIPLKYIENLGRRPKKCSPAML